MTGDALYCQRDLSRRVVAAGGDYLWVVKANQPDLLWEVATLFERPPPGEAFAAARQDGKHGGRRETRRLWASTALAGYSDWPGARQVCKVEREVERRGAVTREVRYLVTSLGPGTGPAELLRLARGHWGIENRLHRVRDATLGEDASHVRSGAAPQVLAALRNAALALLRAAGHANVAAALRHYGWQPGAALALLDLRPQ